MGTRAAAFTAKVRNLNDYHLRLLHGVVPAPSGLDIANTLKYFSQTLLGVLRDVQERPIDILRNPEQDDARLALFPNLDYTALYQAVVSLVDIIPLVQYGTHVFGQALLHTLACIVVFLEREVIETLPYLVASTMTSVPESLHHQVIITLCYHILPYTVGIPGKGDDTENYAAASVPAVLMMIFQYSDNSAFHCELVECLMSLKNDVIKDLLCVIAHGTPGARPPAANLLFYYWPNLNPTLYDRRGVHIKFSDISCVLKAMFNKSAQSAKSDTLSQTGNSDSGEGYSVKGWKPLMCQIEECDGDGTSEASKICLDYAVCLSACPESPPPLYICLDCADEIKREHSSIEFFDILLPMTQVSATCENKNCRSNEKNAVATCFSLECASYNGNRPIRYCSQCNNIRHNNRRGIDHIVHTTIGSPWDMEPQMQSFLIEAIISLLNEAQPFGDKTKNKEHDRFKRAGLLDDVDQGEGLSPEERRLLSRYGVWLVIGLCAPNKDTPVEMLGRILAALCQWFNATQYLPDGAARLRDQQGTAIERLKSEYIHDWLQEVCRSHFDVFVSCLMPHPLEYARVGGHWDTLSTRTDHIKEGFNRLFCMVPYEVISTQVWGQVMPNWMEAIHNDIPEEELMDLRITLSKLLDPEMSPLGFDATQMYSFISVRFENTSAAVQEQTLSWLQLLSSLSIVIPLTLIFSMFEDGVKALQAALGLATSAAGRKTSTNRQDQNILKPVVEDDSRSSSPLSDNETHTSDHPEDNYTDRELHQTCLILMLDILYKQMEVQDSNKHQGVEGPVCVPVLRLIRNMLATTCMSPHSCDGDQECIMCELTITFFQLSTDILTYLCPLIAIQNNRVADIVPSDTESQQQGKGSDSSSQCPATPGGSQTPKHKEQSKGGEAEGASGRSSAVNMPQVVTAKVETVGELDVAAMMPQEQVVKAVARAVMLTEEDVAKANATASVAHPSVVGVDDKPIDLTQPAEDSSEYWITSQGKFKIKLEELPNHLQVIHALLLRLETTEDGDVVYQMCLCLKLLILHGESLVQAATNNRGFLIWCQEHKTVELMWTLIDAEWSHVAEVCVQLLLHFITLPYGADMFWKLCEIHFHHHDWKVRFQAVEKVVVIGRFLGVSSVRQCPGLQAALAHAFCFLLASLDDINVAVAQRASLYLQTIPDSGLKALCWCLEHQFDSVIVDRPMIIQALHQLSTRLPDRKILTWDFFFNRFDALYLEAQIALEKRGEIAYPKDLKNTDMTSDLFARKYTRAQDALTLVQSASVRTLSSSLGTKWPYKRTMSAPANMLNRADKQADGGMRCGEDSSVVQQLQRAMDLEGTDKDTLHLLVFLFMQFLAQPQHSGSEDKGSNLKVMNLVLRHVSVLMGFSPQERSFTIAPNRLRASPVFNAFLSNLPYVLDHNFKMGTSLLPTCLPVLQFCPAPHRMADVRYPSYSLWLLQPHPRHLWLVAVMTMLYKYEYGQCAQVLSLIRIVLNTIDNHFHRCRKVEDPDQAMCAPNSAYSREVSQGSLGGGEEHLGETPPTSPGVFSGGRVTVSMSGHHSDSRVQYHADLKASHIVSNQEMSGSGECDEGEPELEAIPESPKTESPQQSCQESLYELEPLKQMVVAEQAVVCVQEEDNSKARISASPLVVGRDASIVKATKTQASQVTNIMASQLRAFDDSFYVSHKDKIDQYNRGETSKTRTGSDHSHSSWIIGGDDSEDSCSPEQDKVPLTESKSRVQPKGRVLDVSSSRNRKSATSKTSSDTSTSLTSGCLAYIQPHPKVSQDAAIARAQDGCRSNDQGCSGMDEVFNPAQHLSPPSPLSMMDHMTLGSPVEVDGQTSTTIESPNTELTSPPDALELPTPERLLPVGGGEKPPAVKKVEENQSGSILERVWQAFGGWTSGSKIETHTDCDLVEVVSHPEGRTHSAGESKGPTPTLKQISRNEQGSTSTEDTTETSNNTVNSNGPQDICPGKAHGKSKGQRSSSSFTRSSKDKPSTDYTWADPNEPQPHQGGVTCGSGPQQPSIKQSSLRVGEECMTYRCMECGEIIEEFSNDDLGYCIIILSTFVHRQPALAAPLLPRMLHTVAKVSGHEVFSWQYESNIHLPGSATSIGRQFLRCVLHQLAPNQIFNQIFQTHIDESQRVKLFKTLAQALTDFNELNPCAPIQLLLENLNSRKVLPSEKLGHILGNVACYMECVVFDGGTGLSNAVLPLFDTFLRKILFCTAALTDFNPLLRIMVALLRVPGVSSLKSILDPVSKLLSHALQNTPVKYEHLSDLCHLCNRAFSRERDKLLLSRLVVYELVQALKFKTSIPDTNLVQLVQLVVQDCGGTLGSNSVVGDLPTQVSDIQNLQNTCVVECMRSHLPDALEFIADVHTLTKVKSNCRCSVGLNEDTLGGLVKAGIAQYLALEITRGNSRDNRAIMKYLPWLYSPPTTVQQGPKEFIDCVAHIRLLSWLLLGALTHTCLMGSTSSMSCHPIPPEASCHVADHIQVILAGFAEQSKASVLHMSSLFHAFILCQLWTVYLEQMAGSPGSDSFVSISAILTDFWAKVTPGVLQLVSHSKVDSEAAQLGEMVNLHFLSLMEALMECQSTVLTKLLPLWAPVLYTHHTKLPGQLAVRLQACQNAAPPAGADLDATTPNLLRWLHRLEFKMGQIELQSSTATQFYSV